MKNIAAPRHGSTARVLAVIVISTLCALGSRDTSVGQSSVIEDFELWDKTTWRIGIEKNGLFQKSQSQFVSGAASGKLIYKFPLGEKNYVVFRRVPLVEIGGNSNFLEISVFGDKSQHFLNIWTQDSQGQLWQFTFGQILHEGWGRMVASLDPNLPWPTQTLPRKGMRTSIAYPLKLYALVLDGFDPSKESEGTIYLDALRLTNDQEIREPKADNASSEGRVKDETVIQFTADKTRLAYQECTIIRWTVKHVNGYYLDNLPQTGDSGEKSVCPNSRQQIYTLRVLTDAGEIRHDLTIFTAAPPQLCIETPTLDFGTTNHYFEQTSVSYRTAILRNCGETSLTVLNWRFLDGPGPVFRFAKDDEPHGAILKPNQVCKQSVVFRSYGADGTKTDTLELGSNGIDAVSRIVLTGKSKGVEPPPPPPPSDYEYGYNPQLSGSSDQNKYKNVVPCSKLK